MTKTITVKQLADKLKSNPETKLIDVRTAAENRAVHIAAAINIPMENVMKQRESFIDQSEIYIICNSGSRSQMVCEDLGHHGVHNLVNVTGGIQEWMKQKLPVIRTKKWSIPIIQQVMTIAGTLIILGILSSTMIHSHFILLSAGVGIGLLYAGLSGNCYMARLLKIMPWNK